MFFREKSDGARRYLQLVENRWLYLVRLDTDRMELYRPEGWQPWVA